ncbi:hypothetical protein [Streptomyces cyaneofuscatus]|uniref:hypothetical protein n=1 Tax=Streptomyces cyaneofuscatus TaxID=66883 RepID=UPI003F4D9857
MSCPTGRHTHWGGLPTFVFPFLPPAEELPQPLPAADAVAWRISVEHYFEVELRNWARAFARFAEAVDLSRVRDPAQVVVVQVQPGEVGQRPARQQRRRTLVAEGAHGQVQLGEPLHDCRARERGGDLVLDFGVAQPQSARPR